MNYENTRRSQPEYISTPLEQEWHKYTNGCRTDETTFLPAFYVHHVKYAYTCAAFEVLTAVLLKIQAFWDDSLFVQIIRDVS
jgi:hypothetical protein